MRVGKKTQNKTQRFQSSFAQYSWGNAMQNATYEDAILVARILDIPAEEVWSIIKGMTYLYYSELKIAVLNSPSRPQASPTPRFDA